MSRCFNLRFPELSLTLLSIFHFAFDLCSELYFRQDDEALGDTRTIFAGPRKHDYKLRDIYDALGERDAAPREIRQTRIVVRCFLSVRRCKNSVKKKKNEFRAFVSGDVSRFMRAVTRAHYALPYRANITGNVFRVADSAERRKKHGQRYEWSDESQRQSGGKAFFSSPAALMILAFIPRARSLDAI